MIYLAPPNPPREGGLYKVSPTGGDLEGANIFLFMRLLIWVNV